MLIDDLTPSELDKQIARLAKDKNKATKDKPIYVRPHVAFIQGYYRRRAVRRSAKSNVIQFRRKA